MPPRCFTCRRLFKTARSLKLHITKSKLCGKLWEEELNRELPTDLQVGKTPITGPGHHPFPNVTLDAFSDASNMPSLPIQSDRNDLDSLHPHSPDHLADQQEPPAKKVRVTVEEAEDEQAPRRFIFNYHGNAAQVQNIGETEFQEFYKSQEALGHSPWHPFESQDEWQLAEWLMKRVNQTGIEEFLNLEIV